MLTVISQLRGEIVKIRSDKITPNTNVRLSGLVWARSVLDRFEMAFKKGETLYSVIKGHKRTFFTLTIPSGEYLMRTFIVLVLSWEK